MIWIAILAVTGSFAAGTFLVFIASGKDINKKVIVMAVCTVVTFLSGLWVAPQYNVWQQQLEGMAQLAKAEQNRQIAINEAKAKSESSAHLANAEIERAKGAAEANRIVADSLGGSEGYLRWLFLEKLGEIKDGQIIYLPTEAGIPILEANRLKEVNND